VIRVEDLHLRQGSFELSGIHFEVPSGSYGVLMGRTGSGKTTLLEAICGLRRIEGGRIFLAGRDCSRLAPAERGVGYVPQDGALFSTMSVRDHLAFALVVRRWERAAIARRVDELSELLGITHLLGRRPRGLSGGESQRVALGRALAASPAVICLDEPLSALDDETRDGMHRLLKSVQEYTGVTALHVTHSIVDAERLADVTLLLSEGKVEAAAGAPPRLSPPAAPRSAEAGAAGTRNSG
jgi:molybdate/tungstate transport system ATP-binding protein